MYISENKFWYLERVTYLMAGVFNLTGILLSIYVSPYWLLLSILVSINLSIYSLTGFCIMANILYKLGIKPICELKKAQG